MEKRVSGQPVGEVAGYMLQYHEADRDRIGYGWWVTGNHLMISYYHMMICQV